MKLTGNAGSIEFKISLKTRIKSWVYGTFQLRLGDSLIGDEYDDGVDLKGCINWLCDFVSKPRNRCDPELMRVSKETAWQDIVVRVFDPVEGLHCLELFPRFHLSHLGMSSFDQVTLIMINDGKQLERYLWQQDKEAIQEFSAPIGSLEVAAKAAITSFYNQPWSSPATDSVRLPTSSG